MTTRIAEVEEITKEVWTPFFEWALTDDDDTGEDAYLEAMDRADREYETEW